MYLFNIAKMRKIGDICTIALNACLIGKPLVIAVVPTGPCCDWDATMMSDFLKNRNAIPER